jgi:Zn finger protein HypA/HybF involved in hydrogenase expression
MYLYEECDAKTYTRTSKLGHQHQYIRTRTTIVFRCDNCNEIFKREKSKISPKRLSNNYFHCCNNCDSKRFAQKKGAERRTIWDKPASSLDDISKL